MHLLVAEDTLWLVWLLEVLNLLLGQRDVQTLDDVLQVLQAGASHDGRGDAGLGHDPCNGDLSHTDSLLLCELLNALVDLGAARSCGIVLGPTGNRKIR